jgi:hypothetical protein
MHAWICIAGQQKVHMHMHTCLPRNTKYACICILAGGKNTRYVHAHINTYAGNRCRNHACLCSWEDGDAYLLHNLSNNAPANFDSFQIGVDQPAILVCLRMPGTQAYTSHCVHQCWPVCFWVTARCCGWSSLVGSEGLVVDDTRRSAVLNFVIELLEQ